MHCSITLDGCAGCCCSPRQNPHTSQGFPQEGSRRGVRPGKVAPAYLPSGLSPNGLHGAKKTGMPSPQIACMRHQAMQCLHCRPFLIKLRSSLAEYRRPSHFIHLGAMAPSPRGHFASSACCTCAARRVRHPEASHARGVLPAFSGAAYRCLMAIAPCLGPHACIGRKCTAPPPAKSWPAARRPQSIWTG